MSAQTPLIISISGIRGLVGQSLTNDVISNFSSAFATDLPPGAGVVLARDTRPSGEEFMQVAAQALSQVGCRVYDLGACPTPTAKLMVTELGAQGAIIITASHNPAPWNGLKLVRGDGIFLNAEQGARVEALFHEQNFRQDTGGSIEKVPFTDVKKLHIERILAHVDTDAIRRARFKVSIDPCNGTGSLMLPELLQALGVDAHFINAEPNGHFAHEPEPIPANLVQLGQAVRQSGSALGFAIDPDADRVTLVGADGQAIGEDSTLALAVQAVTARQRGPVVTTLSTSQAVSDAANAHDCPVFLTPVGEVHVVEKMIAEGAIIGGEGNGGVILTQIDPGRDAAVGLALVLEAIATTGQSLQQLLEALPSYFIEKRKATCSSDQLEQSIGALLARHPQAYVHPVQDGSKLYMSGELQCPWVHLRASNTEPIARIIAEATSREEASALCDEVEQILADCKSRI
jgi:phosphomannomutase